MHKNVFNRNIIADSSDSEMFHEPENSIPNNFNDEMLQSVMKMANEQLNKTPTVDLEAELTSNTITPQTQVEGEFFPHFKSVVFERL